MQLSATDLARNSSALADRHMFLSGQIMECVTPPIRDGSILLERVGKENPEAKAIKDIVSTRSIIDSSELFKSFVSCVFAYTEVRVFT